MVASNLRSDPSPAPATAWPVVFGALLLFLLRFGYDYGQSDQDEILPLLLQYLSPDLYTRDWFVMTQASGFGIRTLFVGLLAVPSFLLPVWSVVLAGYLAAWLAIGAAVFRLALRWTREPLAAGATVLVTLVFTPQWTLGGNDLVHAMLVPSMAAWALGLWGIVQLQNGRPLLAGMLLGMATWMQALVGLQLAVVMAGVELWRILRREDAWRPLVLLTAAYAVFALPVVLPLTLQQVAAAAPPGASGGLSPYYIRVLFRNPHHYLFDSFPLRSIFRFGLLVGIGLPGGWYLHRRNRLHDAHLGGRVLVITSILSILAYACTELWPVPLVATLQWFKLTVLAKVILVAWMCGAFAAGLPVSWTRRLRTFAASSRPAWALVGCSWLLALSAWAAGISPVAERARPLARTEAPVEIVERYARDLTPTDAVFAVPPSWSGFRSSAQRAVVVTFKAVPHRDDHVVLWMNRLLDLAPIELPARGWPGLQDSLDAAFLRLPPRELLRVAETYGVSYVIRDADAPLEHPSFEPVFAADPWRLYRVHAAGGIAP